MRNFLIYTLLTVSFTVNILFFVDQSVVFDMEKSKEIIFSIVVFLFTYLIASIIAGEIQEKSWKKQHEKYVEEHRIKQAKKIFEETRDKLDKRIYLSRRLCLAINNLEKSNNDITIQKVEERFSKYDDYIEHWNCTLNKMVSDIELAFGKRERNYMYKSIIISNLNPIGKQLTKLYKKEKDAEKSWKVLENINSTNEIIHKFDSRLLNKIKGMEEDYKTS